MEQSKEHIRGETTAEQGSNAAIFEAALIELAEGNVESIEASLKRLFECTLWATPDMAEGLAFMAADHLPRSWPAEHGVRVVKPANIANQEREQLILRVAAYVVTAPGAHFSPEEAFECSSLAINYAASLLEDEGPELGQPACLHAALEDYAVILRGYLEQTVNQMANSRTADEYAEQLTAATVISELEIDLREVYTVTPDQVTSA